MSKRWAFLLVLSFYFSCDFCEKVLVCPMEQNHQINFKTVLDELAQRDHEVTVLASSASILVDPSKPSTLKFEAYPISFTKNEPDLHFMKQIKIWAYELLESTLWVYDLKMQKPYHKYSDTVQKLCADAVLNKKTYEKSERVQM